MKYLILLALSGCLVHESNLAASYVSAVDPDAVCIRWGDNAVLCRERLVLFYCETGANKHTLCQQLADMNPKPPTKQQPATKQDAPPLDPPKPGKIE